MDPNEALRRLRELILTQSEGKDPQYLADTLEDIASSFNGLDNWLSGGGFLPKAWER